MELYLAGGCGEHGRNCFYLENNEEAWLVDCGVMAGKNISWKWPYLHAEQIQKLKAVFLTHSHADHTGALSWLLSQGYEGPVIASTPTFSQISVECRKAIALEKICAHMQKGRIGNLELSWGRSGHCEGSVWLQLYAENKSVLFSGDYTEASRIYPCDKLRNRSADFAVMDCAYGKDGQTDEEYIYNVIETVKTLQRECKLVFLPVPKYGRGLDLLLLLKENIPESPVFGDEFFCRQAEKAIGGGEWYQKLPENFLQCLQRDAAAKSGIVFLSDPQLRGKTGERVREFLQAGACGIMTGTPEAGSLSETLLSSGQMLFARYPVHMNQRKCQEILDDNRIGKVVYYHSPDFHYERRIKI